MRFSVATLRITSKGSAAKLNGSKNAKCSANGSSSGTTRSTVADARPVSAWTGAPAARSRLVAASHSAGCASATNICVNGALRSTDCRQATSALPSST